MINSSLKKNKLFRWIFIGIFVLIIEYDVIVGGATAQQYLGWSATASALFYFISSAILTLLAVFSLLLIPVLSDLLKTAKLETKKVIYSLGYAIVVFIITFTGNALLVSSFMPTQATTQSLNTGIQKEPFNYELFNAVNKKREANKVNTLILNQWACVIAEIELHKNLELGNGKLTPPDSFARTIEQVKDDKSNASPPNEEALPNFLAEYVAHGSDIPELIQMWNNPNNNTLFLDTSYKYGCAIFLGEYGVVVVADSDGNIYAPDKEGVTMSIQPQS